MSCGWDDQLYHHRKTALQLLSYKFKVGLICRRIWWNTYPIYIYLYTYIGIYMYIVLYRKHIVLSVYQPYIVYRVGIHSKRYEISHTKQCIFSVRFGKHFAGISFHFYCKVISFWVSSGNEIPYAFRFDLLLISNLANHETICTSKRSSTPIKKNEFSFID